MRRFLMLAVLLAACGGTDTTEEPLAEGGSGGSTGEGGGEGGEGGSGPECEFNYECERTRNGVCILGVCESHCDDDSDCIDGTVCTIAADDQSMVCGVDEE